MDFAFLQAASNINNLTTYTFSSQNFGAADADRYIICAIGSRSGAAATVNSVTIGGMAATIVRQQAANGDIVALAIAAVPTGTSGDVVVTFDQEHFRAGIALWRAVDIDSATASDTDASTASNPSVTLDVPAGGFAIGAALFSFGSGTASWTGLTERSDADIESAVTFTTASDEFAEAQTGLTITADGTLTSGVGVFASWAPAAAGGITADVPAGAVAYGANVPTSAKSASAPLGLADYAAVAPASAKTAGLTPAAVQTAALTPASAKSATAPLAACETVAIAPSGSKTPAAPLAAVEYAGLAPERQGFATAPVGTCEYAAVVPASSKAAGVPVGGVEYVGIAPASTIDVIPGEPFEAGGTLTIESRFPGRLFAQPAFDGRIQAEPAYGGRVQ